MWKTIATDESIIRAHEPCKLDNYIYRHTLRICSTYSLSTATMVARAHLSVTSIPISPVFSYITACSVDAGTSQYRVIHKSLRDFLTRLRNNEDRHEGEEHINR